MCQDLAQYLVIQLAEQNESEKENTPRKREEKKKFETTDKEEKLFLTKK